jgi:hypothetical protein
MVAPRVVVGSNEFLGHALESWSSWCVFVACVWGSLRLSCLFLF